MKRIFIMLLVVVFFIFLLPSVNAWEWDNKEFYDETTDTYTIRDSLFGIPTTKVSEISRTGLERIGVTIIYLDFNYTLYEDNYEDPFKYIRLDKLVHGNWIEGEHVPFEILIKQGTKLEDENIYTETCSIDSKNSSHQICISSKTGSGSVTVNNYIPLDQTELRSGNYEIRLILEKGMFDENDWILNLNGRELIEWDFLGNALSGYWTFDSTNRTTVFNVDNNSINNFTQFVNTPGKVTNSKLGRFAMQFNETEFDSLGNTTINATLINDDTEFSWSFWINHTGSLSEQKIVAHPDVSFGDRYIELESGDQLTLAVGDGSSNLRVTGTVAADDWHLIVATADEGDALRLYIDNDNVANTTFLGTFTDNGVPFTIGSRINGQGGGSGNHFNGTLDDVGYWNVELTPTDVNDLWNNGDGLAFPNPEFPSNVILTTSLNSPTNNTETLSSSLIFNSSVSTIQNLNLSNATILIYNSTTELFNQSNISVTGDSVINESIFDIGNLVRGTYFWNVQFCGIADNETASAVCSSGVSNRTFSLVSSPIESSFAEFTYETQEETFQENVTLLSGETIDSVNLIYNGTSSTATSTLISGNNFTLQATIDIPTSAVGENTTQFFFSMNLNTGQDNLSAHNQSVGAINLSIFGQGIGGLPYMNFTFQNETVAQEAVGATFSSSWSYFLGSGSVNKTLTFTNASENFNYSFQFHPQNLTLFADMTTDYNNDESQQRTFDPALLTLTNSTLSQILLLLPTSDGIFQQFVTQTLIGATVADVDFVINRSISGVSTEISSGATDGSGFASIFLNPDFTYNALFTKTGFGDNSFSFQPSNQLRTVVMADLTTAVTNGSLISVNTTYDIQPINSSLNNGTSFIFSFNVTSSQSINSIDMNITNSSGFQVGFQSATSATFISQTINTGENRSFVGTFHIATANETLEIKKVWTIGSEFTGDYSIFRQFTLYTTYGFRDFIRFMIAIAIIGGVLMFMTSGEIIDTSESKIGVALLMIWAFSIVGWLTIPGAPIVSPNPTLTDLAQFGNQYGIAILSTGAGVFFVGRRIFT